jgi:outer membrane protein TolC
MTGLWLLPLVVSLSAQELTLSEAVETAVRRHPASEAAQARMAAAGQRVEQAQSGRLPKLNYTESYLRSNNPVFVFSTLLTQRRFGEENFRIGQLNRPDSINNFQSMLALDQTIYDAGAARRQVESAELGRQLAEEQRRAVELNLAAGAARAYFGVLLVEQSLEVANQAVAAAEADLKRAESIRDAGMSTDADVLSLKVHLAAMQEQAIRRRSDLDVARAALNEALGAPLDEARKLATKLSQLPSMPARRGSFEDRAGSERPDARQARLATQLAEKHAELSRAAYYPQISVRVALEADRGQFVRQGGGNWLAAVSLRWNLFNGYADRSRIREAGHALRGAQSDERQTRSAIELQVRRAWAELSAATERIQVAAASVEQAEESLRITRNRYESGLATVTDLLRNETARMESGFRRLAAIHDQRVAAVMLEFAAGLLRPDSDVLR